MRIFITGGAGYIGSHTVLEVLSEAHNVCVYDNYSNSAPEALKRVEHLTNRPFASVEGDVLDQSALTTAMCEFKPDVVIHFAGKKAVAESVENPLLYYETNVSGTLSLLRAMERAKCHRIVFSSSATVYGVPQYLPYDENHPLAAINPYGQTKLMVEYIIKDWCAAHSKASAVLLRYFNPVGAHDSGQIGEDPHDIPNNLMPFVAQVAVGRQKVLHVFGNDYDTSDGTGVRDYIHVVDLAKAHASAVSFVLGRTGCEAINVGTGQGASVLDVVNAFERASGQKIPYQFAPRRAGDLPAYYADPAKAQKLLGWRATRDLADMCKTTWAWQSQNPEGYKSSGGR